MESLLLSSHIVMSLKKTGESVFNQFSLGLKFVLLDRVTVMWLLANADMEMQLWWRTQRGVGGISFSKGYELRLVLEFELFLILFMCCTILFFLKEFCFLFSKERLLDWQFLVKDEVSHAQFNDLAGCISS